MTKNIDKDKIIYTFNVAHIGWEMDNTGWVKETKNGKRYLVKTNAGREIEVSIENLENDIRLYESLLNEAKTALAFVTKSI